MATGESDSDHVLLVETTNDELRSIEGWYLDTKCSNHMKCHREWLVNFDDSKKTNIYFSDNKTNPLEGVGNVLIKGRQENQAFITGVLFVSSMKSNFLSMGQ